MQEKTNKTKGDIISNIEEDALEDYDIGQTYEIFGDDFNIKVSPINSKTHGNISTYIDFSNCEKILREKNKLNESSILTVYQIEMDNPNNQSLINDVQYAVFNEKKEKLDLSVCSKEEIDIYYQIDSSKINTTKINYYSELGIDVFDLKGGFFNDICYSFSEGDSDMVLDDRVSDIYQNYSICEDNCQYNMINLTENLVSCKCSVKTELVPDVNPPMLDTIIRDTFADSNVAVIKCFKLVFSFDNKLQNKGFIIFSILVLLHIPFFIYYAIYNISSLSKFIFSEMNKFHYDCKNQEVNPPKKFGSMRIKYKKKTTSVMQLNKDTGQFTIEKVPLKEESTNRLKMKNKTNLKRKNIQSIFVNNLQNNEEVITKPSKSLKSKLKKGKKSLKKKRKTLKFKRSKLSQALLVDYKVVNKNIISMKGKNNLNSARSLEKLKTQKEEKEEKINLSSKTYSLIQIDANNGAYKTKPINSDFILDNYDYEMAIKYDNRTFWRLFYICVLAKENIINIIFFKTPLDIQPLRFCLFIFCYSSDLAFNTIFYTKQNISDKYHYQGNNLFLFTMVNNLLQIVLSTLVGLILVNVFQHMIDSRGQYEDIFREEESKMRENKNYKVSQETKAEILEKIKKISSKLRIKIVFFIIFEFSIMLFFYYFVTAFCEVYKKTQSAWLYDFFSGFLISFAAEFGCCLLITIGYLISVRYKIKFIYNLSIFFYNL